MLSRMRDSLIRDNKAIPWVLGILVLLVSFWIVAGFFLGGQDEEPVSNRAFASQSQELAQQSGAPAAPSPELENRNAESYAAYQSKDPFRELIPSAEEAAASFPDPPFLHRGCSGIEAQIPQHHDEGGDERGRQGGELVRAARHVTDKDRPQHPGQIADAEIGRTDQEGHVEELGPQRVGVEIGPEGKSGRHAQILEEVAGHEADDGKSGDPSRAVTQRAVEKHEAHHDREIEHGEDEGCGEDVDDRLDRQKRDQRPKKIA